MYESYSSMVMKNRTAADSQLFSGRFYLEHIPLFNDPAFVYGTCVDGSNTWLDTLLFAAAEDPADKVRREEIQSELRDLQLEYHEEGAWRAYAKPLLTYHSLAIEGNTFQLHDVQTFFHSGRFSSQIGYELSEMVEVHGHAKALNMTDLLVEGLLANFTEPILHDLHSVMMGSRLGYRVHQVGVVSQRVVFPQAVEVPALMQRFEKWLYNAQTAPLDTRMSALELATRAHFYFVRIHPFSDGNGRLARLMMNVLLRKHGTWPALILVEDAEAYFHALMRAGDHRDLSLLGRVISHGITCALAEKVRFVRDLRAGRVHA